MLPAVDTLPPPPPAQVVRCVADASRRYHLPPEIVLAIIRAEGGRVGGVQRNTNGTVDVGPMQINSVNFKKFSGYVSPQQLRDDFCVNVHAGSYLLKKSMIEAGDFWKGVGNYHSRTPSRSVSYQFRVHDHLKYVKTEIHSNPLWAQHVRR